MLKKAATIEIEAAIGNLARINVLQERARILTAHDVGPVQHVKNDFMGSVSLQAVMLHHKRHMVQSDETKH
jgi:hypothetical protein